MLLSPHFSLPELTTTSRTEHRAAQAYGALRSTAVYDALGALLVSVPGTRLDGGPVVSPVIVAAGDLVDILVTKVLSLGSSPGDVVASLQFYSA